VVPLSRFTTGSPDEPTAAGSSQGKSFALSFGLGLIALVGSGLPLQAASQPATEIVATEIASAEIVATGSAVTEQLLPEQKAIGSIATKTIVSDGPANQTPTPQSLTAEPAPLTAGGSETPDDLEIAQALAPAAGGTIQPSGPAEAAAPMASPSPSPAPGSPTPATEPKTPAAAAAAVPPPPLELELSADRQEFDNQLQRFVSTGSVRALIGGGR